ncbi:MAG TPA: ribosome biogenesis GTP-binding protein YihA/YsxC [bacterium]|nr:ribosome biogenesis GTP-binding protein YihA/YsxC [bacterium]
MKQLNATWLGAAHKPEEFLPEDGPEIALAGRSNVGKSSLLNALCGHVALARVSKTPGRTRALHFFKTDVGLTLVDFPGYGFAKGPSRDRDAWKALIEAYLSRRNALKAVAVLVDSRHEPSPEDRGLFDWLNSLKKNALCVATKVDKLSGNEKPAQMAMLKAELKLNHKPIAFSSLTGEGRIELVVKLKELARA